MLKRIIAWGLVSTGLVLTVINLYGLSQSIRPAGLWDEPTRFANDYSISYEEALAQLQRLPDESELQFAQRATHVIAQSITHIHWSEEPDATRFNQLIPIWENYFLYFMGLWSGMPEFQKYHYTDYRRSLKRGIGLCGDTSMILNQVLTENGIESDILVFPLHVIVQADVDGQQRLFDADYGVSIPFDADQAQLNRPQIAELYRQHGYTPDDEALVDKIFSRHGVAFDDVKAFVTKKYYFERLTYALKWPLPLIMLLIGWLLLRRWQTKG
ncbi:hypothetical protein IC617_14120 [Neiella sp. HB171785]|uniref:Transglutaminase-like domain-containing protein n=1 Tax=Neiella litorisoli TaxID=2771431 RepID=A0A8J6UMD0_9GAMM|nr:hypothetical protein [Neiella litorisoli]MBD1390570.1 hypothetical protein [Neiella litorisoli]